MNKLFLFLFLSMLQDSFAASDVNSLKPFETDGCTLFVDGTASKPGLWRHCCVEHDMRYWFGGDLNDLDRTDLRLKECVKEVAGSFWATLIYDGVRAGHTSPVKNKTAWGWGWVNARSNISLTSSEVSYVIEELQRLPYDQEIIKNFIARNFKQNYVEI